MDELKFEFCISGRKAPSLQKSVCKRLSAGLKSHVIQQMDHIRSQESGSPLTINVVSGKNSLTPTILPHLRQTLWAGIVTGAAFRTNSHNDDDAFEILYSCFKIALTLATPKIKRQFLSSSNAVDKSGGAYADRYGQCLTKIEGLLEEASSLEKDGLKGHPRRTTIAKQFCSVLNTFNIYVIGEYRRGWSELISSAQHARGQRRPRYNNIDVRGAADGLGVSPGKLIKAIAGSLGEAGVDIDRTTVSTLTSIGRQHKTGPAIRAPRKRPSSPKSDREPTETLTLIEGSSKRRR